MYLDDFRFSSSVVPIATQCLWFGGSPVPIAKPQNAPGAASHDVYQGRAPIFITTSMDKVEALEAAGDGDGSMLMRRLLVVSFRTPVAKPNAHIPRCASCFSRFVLMHGS